MKIITILKVYERDRGSTNGRSIAYKMDETI